MYLLLGPSTALYLQWVCGGLEALVRQSSTSLSVEELPTGSESESTECAEDFIDTGMPEPGAQTPSLSPQLSDRFESPLELLDESIAPTTQTPPVPEASDRRSRRERTKTSKALGNDAQGLTSYGTKRATVAQRVHKVHLTSIACKGEDTKAKDIVLKIGSATFATHCCI